MASSGKDVHGSAPSRLHVHLEPKAVLTVLVAVSAMFFVVGVLAVVTRTVFERTFRDAVWLFDLVGDSTVPTWFASATLLLAAVLLGIIWWDHRREGGRDSLHWGGLAILFLLFSVDEVARIHEWAEPNLSLEGFLFYTWVLLGIPFVIVIGLLYLPFVRRLPADIRHLFLVAGALYVGGALVVEMFNARLDFVMGAESLEYGLLTAAEEGMEMAGVALFVYALLRHLQRRGVSLQLDVGR